MKNNFINGRWVGGTNSKPNINPSNTSDVIDEYAQADTTQVEEAIAAAGNANRAWAHSTPQQRADALDRIANELQQRTSELGYLLAREEGKTLPEAIAEVNRAAQIFRFHAGEAVRGGGDWLPSVRSSINVEISREPVGTVGIIAPWNFPIAIPAWKIAPALAHGNCVVFKPAELAPGSAWALTEVISRAGLPEGAFNLVMGSGAGVGHALVSSPEVHAISFTGSAAIGRTVIRTATARLARVQAEMSGKNPLVVLADADLNVAVECAIKGAFYSTGQRCTASSRLIVDRRVYQEFILLMEDRMKALVVDDACAPGTDIGPVVDEKQLQVDLASIEGGIKEGATLFRGGERPRRKTTGFYLTPALFTDVDPSMAVAREEIFGPVACVIPAQDYDHALELANDTPYGLSAGICTRSLTHAADFKRNAQAGMVMVNCPTAGVDYHVPFGGRKASSFGGREQGRQAIEFFTSLKTSYTRA